jgi:hypothetical protein
VSQDLKAEIKGKEEFKDMKDIEQTTLTKIDTYSYTAILGEPEQRKFRPKPSLTFENPSIFYNRITSTYFSIGPCPVWPGRRCGQAETKWHVPSLMEERSLSQTRRLLNCAP